MPEMIFKSVSSTLKDQRLKINIFPSLVSSLVGVKKTDTKIISGNFNSYKLQKTGYQSEIGYTKRHKKFQDEGVFAPSNDQITF